MRSCKLPATQVRVHAKHYGEFPMIRWLGFDGGARRGVLLEEPRHETTNGVTYNFPGLAYDVDRREFQKLLTGEFVDSGKADDEGRLKEGGK